MTTALSRILDLRDDGGLQGKDIANIVAVSPATVLLWSNGNARSTKRRRSLTRPTFSALMV
jgi:hypothetical protein